MQSSVLLTLLIGLLNMVGAPLYGVALSDLYTEKAKVRDLASDLAWQRLLFYQRHSLVRGAHGIVDDPKFYLDPSGKQDPFQEMSATLNGFFQPQNAAEPDMHPLCRFPARRFFLEQELEGLAQDLPKIPCPRLESWWKDRQYQSLSLVFSSFYPDNPASMFGHIFLRLHRSKAGQGSDLLDDSINFAAFTDTSNPLLYNFKGAFGGFPGRFSLLPYYMKIQEYNNLESRDLWEYPLDASALHIKKILLSLWEFGPHHADYYYFDDNCSYVMLMLMETADVAWDFTSSMRVWATPSSCLKAVVDRPNFILQSKFRPSALSRYQERYDQMNREERQHFAQFFQQESPEQMPDANRFAGHDRASVMLDANRFAGHDRASVRAVDAALEYIDFQEKLAGTQAPKQYADLRNDFLLQRSQQKQAPASLIRLPADRDPRQAVPESWIMLGGADRGEDPFLRLSWQPVLHDLIGANKGYADDMQIQIMPMSFAYDPTAKNLTLEKLDVLNIISVQPYNRLLQPRSWTFQLGYDRQVLCQSPDLKFCPETSLAYGRGAALPLWEDEAAPLAAGFMAAAVGAEQMGKQSVPFFQAGPELLLHGVTAWSQSFAMRGLVARRWNTENQADWYVRAEMQLGLSLARMYQTRLNARWEQKKSARLNQEQNDIQLGLLQYF